VVIVEDTGRVDGGKEKEARKEKGKRREEEKEGLGLVIVGGARRCDACVRENTPCKISLLAIDKWRADVKSGMVFHKNPSGMNCEKGANDRKKRCILPATKEMRDAIVEVPKSSKTSSATLKPGGPPTRGSWVTTRSRGGSSVPSIASGTKRKFWEVEVEVTPASKKMKTAVTPMSQVDFFGAMVRMMESSEQQAAETSRAAALREEFGKALRSMVANIRLQNRILERVEHRWVAEIDKGKGKEKEVEEEEEEEEDDEKGDDAAEARSVPIIALSSVEDSDGEAEELERDRMRRRIWMRRSEGWREVFFFLF